MVKGISGTRTVIEAVRAAVDTMLELPKRGTHVGGGVHMPISDTPGIGWSVTWARPLQNKMIEAMWFYPTDELESKDLAKVRKLVPAIRAAAETVINIQDFTEGGV